MGLLKKKINFLLDVKYNKFTKSCKPCMDACKKVDKKINGRKLSSIKKKEMTKLLKVYVSS